MAVAGQRRHHAHQDLPKTGKPGIEPEVPFPAKLLTIRGRFDPPVRLDKGIVAGD
jgi:hypothetical protein